MLTDHQIGSAKNKHKMVEYLESAAKLGDQYARLRLASLYQSGELLKKDQVKAENILLSLIEDGVVGAMFNITLLDTMSEDKKINYLKRASDLGHSKAKYNLFVKYKERGDSVSDIKHLLYESANLGDMDAKTALGLYHFRGDEYFKKDIDVAIKYLKEPASNGSSKAQYILGTAYVFSIKSEEDYLNAEHWLMKSKNNGYLPAEKALKQLYVIYNKIKHKFKD